MCVCVRAARNSHNERRGWIIIISERANINRVHFEINKFKSLMLNVEVNKSLSVYTHSHTHTQTHTQYMCVCLFVCVRVCLWIYKISNKLYLNSANKARFFNVFFISLFSNFHLHIRIEIVDKLSEVHFLNCFVKMLSILSHYQESCVVSVVDTISGIFTQLNLNLFKVRWCMISEASRTAQEELLLDIIIIITICRRYVSFFASCRVGSKLCSLGLTGELSFNW